MIIRRAQDRGHFENEWLSSFHTFSFADYYDAQHMNFHDLRVINEDVVEPSGGFPTHSHHDMEIITYVIEGAVAHKDSMGNETTLKAGEVQVMSAGRGVRHSEFNPSSKERLKLLQIWIKPARLGLTPGYAERGFSRGDKLNQMRLIVSGLQDEGALKIHQDVNLYAAILEPERPMDFRLFPERAVWIQMVRGDVRINNQVLHGGDGAAFEQPGALTLTGQTECEFLLFDLAKRSLAS